MASLHLRQLQKNFGNVRVIQGISLDIKDGEFMVFVGPSGCGKSTTLRMIAGLEEISGGELLIADKRVNDVPAAQRGVAMVFQSYALYPHMTVAENLGFALKLSGRSRAEIATAVDKAARILQLEPLLERKPKALSGGQRQRVAIGRAIVRQPDVFLFDEPLSNLDAALRVQMRVELALLHHELKTTMVYVTHDQVEAMTLGDRIAVFNQGVIEQCGTPLDLYEHPVNRFVASFIGSPSMNFLPATPHTPDSGTTSLQLPGQASWALPPIVGSTAVLPHKLTLGLRPEHLELVAPDQGIAACIDLVEHLGSEQIVHVQLAKSDARLIVKLGPNAPHARHGEAVGLQISPNHFHLFGPDDRTLAL
jgi:multiple sugar transport system ATP-binding protein